MRFYPLLFTFLITCGETNNDVRRKHVARDGNGEKKDVLDVSPTGACKDVIIDNCSQLLKKPTNFLGVHPEQIEFLRNGICLKHIMDDALTQGVARDMRRQFTKECENEVEEYFRLVSEDLFAAFPEIEEDCSSTLEKECRDDKSIRCLQTTLIEDASGESSITRECEYSLFSLQVLKSRHWELEKTSVAACEGDIKLFCKDEPPTKIRSCLQSNNEDLSDECAVEIFDGDVRKVNAPAFLDQSFQRACRQDMQTYCKDIVEGGGKLLDCLYQQAKDDLEVDMWNYFRKSDREHPSPPVELKLDEGCRNEVVRVQGRAFMDYRLNPTVKKFCMNDIKEICPEEKRSTDLENKPTGMVIGCLMQNFVYIEDARCASAVKDGITWQQLGFHNLSFVAQKKCRLDFMKYCKNAPGLECFLNNFQALEVECQSALVSVFHYRELIIDFDPVLKHTCKMRIDELCDEATENVLHCLLNHQAEIQKKDKPCGMLIKKGIERTQQDHRLKYGVSHFCKRDMENLCQDVKSNLKLQCLMYKANKVKSRDCAREVEDLIRGASMVVPNAHCMEDVEKFCVDIDTNRSQGQVHKCLVQHLKELSDECAKEEFQLELVKGDRLHLHPNLESACARERNKICHRIPDEDGQVMRCLEDQLDELGPECEKLMRVHLQNRNRDFRFSPQFAFECRADIHNLCPAIQVEDSFEEDLDLEYNSNVIQCMIDQRKSITNPACLEEVRRKIRQRSEDARMIPNMVGSLCQEDIDKFCANVKTGKGRIHACLAEHLDNLNHECKKFEFKHQMALHEELTFDPTVTNPCQNLVKKCSKRELFECLWDLRDDPTMTGQCRKVVQSKAKEKMKSMWFNSDLVEHCEKDLSYFILQEMPSCSGLSGIALETIEEDIVKIRTASRIQCLTDNFEAISSQYCKNSAKLLLKLQLANPIANRRGFVEACGEDAQVHCGFSDTSKDPYHGYDVFKCLAERRSQISPECDKSVEKIVGFFFSDFRLHPRLMQRCSNEIEVYCHDVQKGGGVVFACLRTHLSDEGFGLACKMEIEHINVPPELMTQFQQTRQEVDHMRWKKFQDITTGLLRAQSSSVRDFFSIFGIMCMGFALSYLLFYGWKKFRTKGYTVFVAKD